jgi:GDP-D-mannose dehydratase
MDDIATRGCRRFCDRHGQAIFSSEFIGPQRTLGSRVEDDLAEKGIVGDMVAIWPTQSNRIDVLVQIDPRYFRRQVETLLGEIAQGQTSIGLGARSVRGCAPEMVRRS